MKKLALILLLTIAGLCSSGTSYAGEGIYGSFSIGPAGVSSMSNGYILSGSGAELDLRVGHHASSGFTLFGELYGIATEGITADGDTCTECSMTVGSHLLPSIGAGYYSKSGFSGLFSIGAPSFAISVPESLYGPSTNHDLGRGVMTKLTLGKDWLVADHVGLGLALNLGMGSFTNYSGHSVGVGTLALSFGGSFGAL